MKRNFINNILSLFYLIFIIALASCSDHDTKINPTTGLIKITEGYALGAGAKIELWAEGDLFAGYNKVYFTLYDSTTGASITDSHIHLNPVMNMSTMSHSCPAEEPESEAVNQLFPGAIMFTMPSGEMGTWTLEVKLHNHVNGLSGKALFNINVQSNSPTKVISFATDVGARYYLSYYFPNKMKVGINDFELIAYTVMEGKFIPADNLTLNFSPEMPSMDHGSPNNENPVNAGNGHYVGKANFTMTGDWRLNFELLDESGSAIAQKYFDIQVD